MMLAGIGPKNHLDEIGIPLKLHMEGVGRNLQDHIAMGGVTYLIESPPDTNPTGAAFVLPRVLTFNSLTEFLRNQRGPLYAQPVAEAMAFLKTKLAT